jgi:hypothetical protein
LQSFSDQADDNGCTVDTGEPAVRRMPLFEPSQLWQGDTTMSCSKSKHMANWKLALLLVWPAVTLCTGCQIDVAGQTLPSPWYLTDDIQYYAPGPEFKLAREAAAMQEQSEAVKSELQNAPGK